MSAPSLTIDYPQKVIQICEAVRGVGGRGFAVGGSVRDALLGERMPVDFDLEVFGLAAADLEGCLKSLGRVQLVGKAFGVYKLSDRTLDIDIALPRREKKSGRGHRGFETEADPFLDFETACARRDLTINAMLHDPLEQTVIDPLGGYHDLRKGLLRHSSEAFAEDPLRALRVAQFAARLRFDVDPSTLALCRRLPLSELPRERLYLEIRKILLDSLTPSWGLEILERIEADRVLVELGPLIRERQHDWTLTRLAMDQAAWRDLPRTRREVIQWALLLSRIDPLGSSSQTQLESAHRLLQRLTREQKLLDSISALLHHRDALEPLLESALTQAMQDSDLRTLSTKVSLPALIEFQRAQKLGRPDAPDEAPEFDRLHERTVKLGLENGPPTAWVQGRDLIAWGCRPGPSMGKMLKDVYQQQLSGALEDREQALTWVKTQIEQNQP